MLWTYVPLYYESTGWNNIQTTVKTSKYPVYYVDFPAIAICNRNLVNWEKIGEAEKRFLPKEYSKELSKNFRKFVGYLSNFRFDNLRLMRSVIDLDLYEFDHINITSLLEFLSFNCEDILRNCLWIHEHYDCCQWFVKEKTEKGFCLVFNSLISDQSKEKKKILGSFYPLKDSKSGLDRGLQLDIHLSKSQINRNFQRKTGVYIMIKNSEDWSHRSYNFVPGNSKFKFLITPEVTEAETAVKAYDPENRRCLFDVSIFNISRFYYY